MAKNKEKPDFVKNWQYVVTVTNTSKDRWTLLFYGPKLKAKPKATDRTGLKVPRIVQNSQKVIKMEKKIS